MRRLAEVSFICRWPSPSDCQSQASLIFRSSREKRAETICPVCEDEHASYFGQADCDVRLAFEPDGRSGSRRYIDDISVRLMADRFICDACELRLEGADELEAAGLDKVVDDWDDPYMDFSNLENGLA